MANGFVCRNCGLQETEHDYPEYCVDDAKPPCDCFELHESDLQEQIAIDEKQNEQAKNNIQRIRAGQDWLIWYVSKFGWRV